MAKNHPLFGKPLSEREKEIIRLAGAGNSNKEIGDILYLSPHTVKSFLSRSSHKTGLSSRIRLVVWLLAQDIKEDAYDLNSTMYQFTKYGYQG